MQKDLSLEDSSSDEAENETGEDIGILDEAFHFEDECIGDSFEDDFRKITKDPDWNANMEEEETDSSDDDELSETKDKDNGSPDA